MSETVIARTGPARLLLFALAGLVAVLLGWVLVPTGQVARVLQLTAYGFTAVLVAGAVLAGWMGWRRWRRWLGPRPSRPWSRRPRAWWGGVAALAAVTLFLHAHFPHRFKVLNDEVALLGTSMAMHQTRGTFVPIHTVFVDGALRLESGYVDKRPFLFPFLVSVIHDLTGYRIDNPIYLNFVLTPVLLGLLLLAGRAVAGRLGGWLTLALFVSLPLVGQNVTGGGFEILNLILLLAVIVLGGLYLRSPRAATLLPLVFTVLLLAYTRYESSLFVLPVAGIILSGWIRHRRLVLPWAAFAAPFLLVPIPWLMRAVQDNYASFFQLADLKVETAFSLAYLGKNASSAVSFFLHGGGVWLNSTPLVVCGVLGLVGFIVSFSGRLLRRQRIRPMEEAFAWLAAGTLLNFSLLLCYHWGQLEDPIVARLSLPLHAVFALAAAWLVGEIARHWAPVRIGALIGASVIAAYIAPPVSASHHLEKVAFPILRQERTEDFMRRHNPAEVLVITDSPVNFVTGGFYAMPMYVANRYPELVRRYLDGGVVKQIFVAREYDAALAATGGYSRRAQLDDCFEIELVEVDYRNPAQRWEVSRLVRVKPVADGDTTTPDTTGEAGVGEQPTADTAPDAASPAAGGSAGGS